MNIYEVNMCFNGNFLW